jgi:hypothetical protein
MRKGRSNADISSASPLDPPLLDPGFFINPLDEKLVYECT